MTKLSRTRGLVFLLQLALHQLCIVKAHKSGHPSPMHAAQGRNFCQPLITNVPSDREIPDMLPKISLSNALVDCTTNACDESRCTLGSWERNC